MLRTLFDAQIRLRNASLRLIGRAIGSIDRQVHSWTARYEDLELDLLAPRAAGQHPIDPIDWFRRLSFPHMAATTAVWLDVMLAIFLLPHNETAARVLYSFAVLLYPATFYVAARGRPWLRQQAVGPWVIGAAKGTGALFGGFSMLLAFLTLFFLFAILAVVWLFVAVLAIILLPGVGWIAVSSEVKGILDLLKPKPAQPAPPEP